MEAPTNQCDLVPPALKAFCESKRNQRIRTDAAFAFSAALVVILVSLGGWGHRYRHHFLTRLLLLGASTLFLPVLSYVFSAINTAKANKLFPGVEWCFEYGPALLLTWAVLVPMVAINTATLVTAGAGDGEGRSISPLWELMARLSWTSYLTFYCREKKVADRTFFLFNLVTCALGIVEILLKIFSFEKARRSFALGPRNPRLIAGYMDQLRNRRGDEQVVDLLVVMGEDEQEIEEGPVGYRFKGLHERGNGSLVTLQRVRSMASSADGVLSSLMPPIQDLCLSFSLFKLMRRRFAGCRTMEQGHGVAAYLLDSRDPESVVRIIADELSFLCDLYYSSLPVSYSSGWSPVASILVSLAIVTYCLAAGVYWFWAITHDHRHPLSDYQFSQIYCQLESNQRMAFGNVLFALVLTAILLIAVVLAEAWAITSYFCSNWTKVTLICYYITNSSWQRSPVY